MKLQSGRGRSHGRGELPLDGLSCLAGQRVSGVSQGAEGNKLDGTCSSLAHFVFAPHIMLRDNGL